MIITRKTYRLFFIIFLIGMLSLSCSSQSYVIKNTSGFIKLPVYSSPIKITKAQLPVISLDYRKEWVEITTEDTGILLDIRYASDDNFLKKKVYPCGKCFLRPEVAKALVKIQNELKKSGYGLKLYDCYRPLSIQKIMWKIKPDPTYVANPEYGSMHNRGLAIDVSIIDEKGREIPMGTPYDSFSPKAHSDYTKLPADILQNRKKLYEIMHQYDLEPIRTEWWHFSYRKKTYPVGRWIWKCD